MRFYFLVFSFLFNYSFAQQLIINEVSQGPGSSEYVEFLVAGNPTCAQPVPCLDLRKVVFDDNNGYFASGSGTGIAGGAVRFANTSFWSCIPQGTLILIYNDGSTNPAIPSQDLSMTDGNCVLVLPASSTLLERTTVSPTTSNSNYPPDASWVNGGNWNPLAMSNTDDSFQLPNLITGAPSHSVSWGNNTNGTIIYFSGSAAGKVFSMVNTFSNDWNLQGNWESGDVFTDESPGVPNSNANLQWINSMNPYCGAGMTLTLTIANETCVNTCDGSASVVVSNGQAPYTYLWSNGATSAQISNLCPGVYSVEVTGANGCSITEEITVQAGTSNPVATVNQAGPFLNSDQSVQISATPGGGSWSSDCGSCLNSSGIFSPQTAGVGTHSICYTIGSGNCSDQDCISIVVLEDCQPQLTSETITICSTDSVLIFNNWESTAGTYSSAFVDVNGCDSTHSVSLVVLNALDQFEIIKVCELDSIELFGAWYYSDTTINQIGFTTDGCEFVETIQVDFYNCIVEDFAMFIPNVFTPNNDQVNDSFSIQIVGGQVEEGFIFNRWGEIVYTFDSSNSGWDGRDQRTGKQVQDGVYTYLIYFKPAESPRDKKHGFVTLIR